MERSVNLIGNRFQSNRINAEGGGLFLNTRSGVVTLMNNFFMDNSANGMGGGAFLRSESGSITLLGNTFVGNNSNNAGGGACILSASGDITLLNNHLRNNSSGNEKGGGAFLRSERGMVYLINNTITQNSGSLGGGVHVALGNTAKSDIYNNIIWNNTARAGGNDGDDLYVDNDLEGDGNASSVNMAHNLFSPSPPTIDFSQPPQTSKVFFRLTLNYNQSVASGCITSGNFGNIQGDPRFVDFLKDNLRLSPGSSAIDAGCSFAPSIPSSDRDQSARIAGRAVDMGAYEFTGQASVTSPSGTQTSPTATSQAPRTEQATSGYILTINKAGTGTGRVSSSPYGIDCGNTCTAQFLPGTKVTLNAVPSPDSMFSGWTGDCQPCNTNTQCQIEVNSARTCNAVFNRTADLLRQWYLK